jgi:hypothetical protein
MSATPIIPCAALADALVAYIRSHRDGDGMEVSIRHALAAALPHLLPTCEARVQAMAEVVETTRQNTTRHHQSCEYYFGSPCDCGRDVILAAIAKLDAINKEPSHGR